MREEVEPEPPPPSVVYSRTKENINDHQTNDGTAPNSKDGTTPGTIPIINLEDLIGRTFLTGANADGTRDRVQIKERIDKHDKDILADKDRAQFRVTHGKERDDDIMTYNEILHHLENDESQNILWKYKRITSHQGPLNPKHPDYNGSSYNVMIEWENGEISAEPLNVIAKDDPVAVAVYAKDNDLLNTPGWKRFKAIAKRHKKYIRLINQAKLQSYRHSRKYMFGFEVPKLSLIHI